MAQPRNRLPEQENERIINETLRRARLEFATVNSTVVTSGGGGGGPAPTPTNGSPWVPKVIADGKTFTVPSDTQILWAVPIDIEGTLDIQSGGSFVMVG